MDYYFAKAGQKMGPVSREDVYRRLESGELSGSDLGWHEGLPEWQPLLQLLPPPTPRGGAVPVFSTPQAGAHVPQAETATSAIISLICGVLGLFTLGLAGIPAIILGHVARGKIKKSAGRLNGGGLALTGLILGYAMVVLIGIAVAASIGMHSFTKKLQAEQEAEMTAAATTLIQKVRGYAEQHDGNLPPTLQVLELDDPALNLEKLQGPSAGMSPGAGWAYFGANMKLTDDPTAVILSASGLPWPLEKSIIVQLDGVVRFTDLEEFELDHP